MKLRTQPTMPECYDAQPSQLGERLNADHYHKLFDMQATELTQLKVETQHGIPYQGDKIDTTHAQHVDDHDSVAHTPPDHDNKQDALSPVASPDDTIEVPATGITLQPGVEDVTPIITFIEVNET